MQQVIFKDEEHFNSCKCHYNKYFKGLSAKDIDQILPSTPGVDVYNGLRYPSKVERERLQGVPEGYTNSLTDNQAACLLGDGWNVQTISHFFKELV